MKRRRSTEIASAALVLMLSIFAAPITTNVFAAESRMWPRPTYYTVVVRPRDTLASLAARFRVPAAAVAKLNRINADRRIAAGKILRIPAGSSRTREAVLAEALDRTAPNYAPPPKTFAIAGHVPARESVAVREPSAHIDAGVAAGSAGALPRPFAWPVRGRVISSFGPTTDGERNDGINIAAMLGAPIHAAAAGTVTYAGDALKAYGNLILIAHPGGYVTAYAHAQGIVVVRGDHVDKGQIIGTAGETGGVDRPQLHFEIREGVKPLNPERLLTALP
jgi:murein DD-endopeptidase MepM/ murein hydrolase activator NlpD